MISYKEWSETAESTYTCNFGQGSQSVRDVYTLPNGTEIFTEAYLPRHWGIKPRYRVLVCLTVKDSKKYRDLVKKYNGELEDTYYGEEGWKHFIFEGKNADEDSYNFAMNERDEIIKEFVENSIGSE